MEKIQTNRLDRGFFKYQDEFEAKALEVLRSGWYILGKEVSAFEEEFSSYIGTKYCAGLASGLDALILGIRALGIGKGDEVLVQGNTYIASVMGITVNGATPVFIDPDEYHSIDADKLEAAITDKTKAVMVVHLYGEPADMDKVVAVCKKHNLKLIEDCAQSHGACFKGKMTGSFGDVGCFSFYPSKNIGAFGDAGALVTNDEEILKKVKMLRNYGSEVRYYFKEVGMNSRLDEIQAGLLRVRLSHVDELTKEREQFAAKYKAELNNPLFTLPPERENANCVWHQFVIRTKKRETLINYLNEHNVGTIIHYPIPPHLSECYAYMGYKKGSFPLIEQYADEVLSIPMYNGMTDEEQDYVIKVLNDFKG
ncbi:MAG: DegT/DnrJ/EryC1/StrS family aminotransferase [Lachnospiraceae bacterium]|nr:DegT/DnrJ/EryC1/StrS family aminotransferase [Lachnospiraceae bacterium]